MEGASGLSIVLKGWEWWMTLPLAAVLGYLICKLYRRETEPYSLAGSRLRMLRTATVVLLALLLSQPVIHRVLASFQPPRVIVLRDVSTSMSVKDNHDALERRVRLAIALDLLDGKLRDTSAEQAATALAAAQTAIDSSAATTRQAQQFLQESAVNVSTARDRVSEAREALKSASSEVAKSLKQFKAENGQPDLKPQVEALGQALERMRKELGDVALDANDTAARLSERARAIAASAQDAGKLAAAARQQQDRIDRSLDESGKPEVKAALEKLAKMDRAAVLKAMIEGKAADAAKDKVDLIHYGFDTDLRDLVPSSERAKDLPPTDTDLAAPLVKIGERQSQDAVSAVVICSDGRHTSGAIPEDAARVLAARGITVHTVGIGSLDAPPDLCVARLEGTLSVFMEETIRLNAQIRTAGFKGQKCQLVLTRGEQVLQQRELTIGDDGWRSETFDIPADKPGANIFTASIKPLPGEALTNNNSAEALVEVANDRLKVLLIDEYPRWESRYVASLLRRERKMTLDERWLLSGENLGPRPKALPEGDKALEEYEIIVLGDVAAERLPEADQKRLAAYVADRGGFLVMIAGPENLPTKYGGGPIADLLPIRTSMPGGGSPLTAAEAGKKSRVKLDSAGARHEIVRILRDPGLNDQLFTALPELPWVARPSYAKPGATPLIVTDDARKDVVVATQYYGAGRVFYVGTDGTWNWRYKVGDRVHAFFWSQAMRWGTSNRLSGGPRLKAGSGRRQIRPGENIEVLARPRDNDGKSVADAVVVAELLGAEHPQKVQLQMVPENGGLYRGFLQNMPAGVQTIRVSVTSPGFEGIQQEIQVIARENAGQEGVELARDAARLAAVAKAGNGRYVDILDAPELFSQLAGQGRERTQESSYQAWSSYPMLLLVVGLLAIEWVLRKRMGLA